MVKIIRTDVKSWSEFRKIVFEEIYNIIENNLDSPSYEITGLPFLSIRLVLQYEDHSRVCKFVYLNESIEMVSVTLYKKDFTK